jgi:hypothetical protein
MTHDVTQFSLGETINPDDYTIRIRIISIEPLQAEVCQTSDRKPVAHWFPMGRVLTFSPGSPENTWLIDKPSDLPWFVLFVGPDGLKHFEHYR